MKYFTPELYLAFNSEVASVAENAHKRWESALAEYKSHLKQISSQLTSNVRKFAKSLCLHDANYLGLAVPKIPHLRHSVAVLAVRRDSTTYLLVYMLVKEPRIRAVRQPWPFAKRNVHWLYDEFDIDRRGSRQHEVLLSDGKTISLEFTDMQVIKDQEAPAFDAA